MSAKPVAVLSDVKLAESTTTPNQPAGAEASRADADEAARKLLAEESAARKVMAQEFTHKAIEQALSLEALQRRDEAEEKAAAEAAAEAEAEANAEAKVKAKAKARAAQKAKAAEAKAAEAKGAEAKAVEAKVAEAAEAKAAKATKAKAKAVEKETGGTSVPASPQVGVTDIADSNSDGSDGQTSAPSATNLPAPIVEKAAKRPSDETAASPEADNEWLSAHLSLTKSTSSESAQPVRRKSDVKKTKKQKAAAKAIAATKAMETAARNEKRSSLQAGAA